MAQEVFALDETSSFLTYSSLDLDQLLDSILNTTIQKLGLKAGAIRFVDEHTGELFIRACCGLTPHFLSLIPTFESQSRFSRLIKNGEVLQVLEVAHEADLSFTEAAQSLGIVSLLAVGLFDNGKIIGALSVYTSEPHQFTEIEIHTLRTIANHAAIAIRFSKMHKFEMEIAAQLRELEVAAEIQAGILPQKMPEYEGLQIAAQAKPWEKVGGDFFDLIELPEQNLGLAIGDVSGKGINAALLMVAVRMALRSHVEHEYALREIINRVNNAIQKDTRTDQFATLFYGVLNVSSKVLTFVNAGHPPPVILRNGEVMALEMGGIPIGISPNYTYLEASVTLQSGDLLVLYTDGYTDIVGADEELFEVDRFVDCLAANQHLPPALMIENIDKTIAEFIRDTTLGDDRTIMILKID